MVSAYAEPDIHGKGGWSVLHNSNEKVLIGEIIESPYTSFTERSISKAALLIATFTEIDPPDRTSDAFLSIVNRAKD